MMEFLEKTNSIIWGPATVFIILMCGIFFTLKSRFFQIRYLKRSIKTVIKKEKNKENSSFKVLSAALAGTIGTGNIAGVATSIALGGPGAVFWMIVSAFFGMMTKFAEVVLAVKFRIKTKTGFSGGPMYYIEKGLGIRWLGVVFACLLAFSAFGIGNMVQSNSVSTALFDALGVDKKATGICLTIICFFIIIGGSKIILSATELIVPAMALFYLGGSILFIILNYKNLPTAIYEIFSSAFEGTSFIGGTVGFTVSKAIQYGMSRGVFTNEAGMGSSSVVHSCANVKSPAEQGLWGIFEVFFDTVIMCSLTALVILTAGLSENIIDNLNGMELTICAFETLYGSFGGIFISISIIFFAIATIFGWGLYGEKAVIYLFGENKTALFLYKILYILAIYIGAIMPINTVWLVSDCINGLLIFPNVTALILLNKYIFNEIENFTN